MSIGGAHGARRGTGPTYLDCPLSHGALYLILQNRISRGSGSPEITLHRRGPSPEPEPPIGRGRVTPFTRARVKGVTCRLSTDPRSAFRWLMPLSQDRMREDHLTRTFEEKVEALSGVKRVKGRSSNGNSIKRQRLDP